MEPYEPEVLSYRRIWARWSPATREARLTEAQRRLAALQEVASRPSGESEREATARVVTWAHRSSFRRWQDAFSEQGFDGLIDWRISPESPMPEEAHQAICTLRRADPNYAVEDLVAFVSKHYQFETSATTVKRILREAGLARRPGRPSGQAAAGERRLEFGGMKLVEAAAEACGYVHKLATAFQEHVRELPVPAEPRLPDVGDRDEFGRFESTYNERFRKGPDDVIGPGFASVQDKREGMDPSRLQVGQVRPEIVERKLYALMTTPLLSGGRWDGLRVSRGDLLEELCGFAYMPATLDKFTRELKYAGVSNTGWETHARLWLEQTRGWGEERLGAVLYVDGSSKPVWTRLFSQSTPISSNGRTMPGLEQVAFHSGYGVPLWQVTHSGRAPLVKVVPELLQTLESQHGPGSVGRIVVIDAEGNSVPFLKGLEEASPARAWVTRLRPSWVEGRKLESPGRFRKYRTIDRVRDGLLDFTDSTAADGGTFQMRVVQVERKQAGRVVWLGASTLLDRDEWGPAELADLYFGRWPSQEANFRAVNQAVGSKEVHGYGKRLVDNVSVVTKLDTLEGSLGRGEVRRVKQTRKVSDAWNKLSEATTVLGRRQRRQETVAARLEALIVPGATVTKTTQALLQEQQALAAEVAQQQQQVGKRQEQHRAAVERLERTYDQLGSWGQEIRRLEENRQVFAHDVELDSLFSLLKVGMVLLVTWVLKELLGDARMEVSTFLDRVATLPARMRGTETLQLITFEYNRRDPEIMGLLQRHSEAINAAQLKLNDGRILRVAVDPPPKSLRPPPPSGSRVGTGDRFKK